ncbi:MAG: hypothetical protein GX057_05210 [Clostridiales bacterium]|nr:hypothetical protein [Clostridiales bacterium]
MAKTNPADEVTSRYLEIQATSAPRMRGADMLLVILCAVLFSGFGILIWVLPHQSFSPDENRNLARLPEFSIEALTSGKYTREVGSFYADQFPLRQYFVGLKAVCELASLKMQNNNVIPCAGGNLVKRLEYTDYSKAEKNLAAIDRFRDALMPQGIPVITAVAPRPVDVLRASLPPLYGSDRSGRIWEVIAASGTDSVDLLSPIRSIAEDGEHVWYRTDHHWTTRGAYAAYLELAKKLGYSPKPLSFFEIEVVSDEFYGTTWSSSGMRWTKPDTIEFYRYTEDEEYTTLNVLTGEITQGFYATGYLDTKDKYAAFLGGNSAHVRVAKNNSTGRPTLLVVKDSYANALVPFLAIHFDLEIIDLRFYTGSTAALAVDTKAAAVLILCGADTIASSDELTLLGYGLSSLNGR